MSTLFLVRHGQASAGTDDYDRLSPLGKKQSTLLGEWWLNQNFSAHVCAHGSLQRQRETAKFALSPLKCVDKCDFRPIEHAGLNEYDHHSVDSAFGFGSNGVVDPNMSFERYFDLMQRWRDAEDLHPSDRPEPWLNFHHRGWQSAQELLEQIDRNQNLVMFTSGGVIANIISVVLGLDFEHTIDAIWRIRNTSITTLYFDGRNARLVDFNTVPHLHCHHDNSLITLI